MFVDNSEEKWWGGEHGERPQLWNKVKRFTDKIRAKKGKKEKRLKEFHFFGEKGVNTNSKSKSSGPFA